VKFTDMSCPVVCERIDTVEIGSAEPMTLICTGIDF
jgi:hypothetical protein